MKRNLLMVILLEFVLYAIQFLIIPITCNNVIGRGNEGIAVLCFTTVLITVAGMLVFLDKMSFWLFGILIYTLLIFLYSPKGAYGIGISGIDLDGLQSHYDASGRYLGIAVVVAIVAFLQFAVWCLIKVFKITSELVKKEPQL